MSSSINAYFRLVSKTRFFPRGDTLCFSSSIFRHLVRLIFIIFIHFTFKYFFSIQNLKNVALISSFQCYKSLNLFTTAATSDTFNDKDKTNLVPFSYAKYSIKCKLHFVTFLKVTFEYLSHKVKFISTHFYPLETSV